MNILSDHEFSTKPVSSDKSCIFLGGAQTHKKIDGTYLELCVKVDERFIVFMTDDIPSEDMLHVHLLDKNLDVIDSATIGGMYSTGSFENYNLQEPNKITFNFIGGNEWVVELLKNKEFRVPFISSPKGVYRKNPFNQHFKLHGNPSPEVESK